MANGPNGISFITRHGFSFECNGTGDENTVVVEPTSRLRNYDNSCVLIDDEWCDE